MSKTDGSITPRTIRHGIDFRVTEEVAVDISRYDNQFQEQYTQRNQTRSGILQSGKHNLEVLRQLDRYCSNGKTEGLKAKISAKTKIVSKIPEAIKVIKSDQLAHPLEFIKIFQHRENNEVPNLEFDPLKPIVRHYGINSSNGSIFVGHIIKDEQLHPVEFSIFNKALDYLKDKIDAGTFLNIREPIEALPKPNNVVLVSFFPRSGSESDKFLLNETKTIVADEKIPNEVEIHTIALWKTGPKEITIIDPTDRIFSQFLKKTLEETYHNVVFQIEDYGIEAVDGKIYKPKHCSDKKLLEFARDCTDIAVKIAFELNEKQTDQSVKSIKAALVGAVEQISNTSLPKEIGLFKPLQSSDVDTRLSAKKLIDKAITVTQKLIEATTDDKAKKSFDQFFLKALDITKITNLEEIQEVSNLIGTLNIEDTYM